MVLNNVKETFGTKRLGKILVFWENKRRTRKPRSSTTMVEDDDLKHEYNKNDERLAKLEGSAPSLATTLEDLTNFIKASTPRPKAQPTSTEVEVGNMDKDDDEDESFKLEG